MGPETQQSDPILQHCPIDALDDTIMFPFVDVDDPNKESLVTDIRPLMTVGEFATENRPPN